MDGLSVAKKINTEAITTKKDGSKQRTIQRLLVEDFKLNPKVKEAVFEVK
jgi:predicted transcriptional regulator